ncbi:MAG: recombination protein O N-terminal domain-containing protein [Muribaculaceae bacterium]|nr:recombination protein O N-terminal domain-containing protein [Muribaculaceae bacterium]
MREKLTAISLYTIKYSDKNSIVHLFTRQMGRVALLLPQGMTAAARRRNALFMPLSVLDVEAVRTAGSDLLRLKEVNALDVGHELHLNPMKNAIALFLSELLGRVVIDREDSSDLFDFATQAARLLEYQQRGLGNFHICFMMKLAILLGIYPDLGDYSEGYGFDMQEAQFVRYDRLRPLMLGAAEARGIYNMSRMTFANMHCFKYSRAQRGEMLERMLQYYKLHGALSGELKSPEVLVQLFG